MSPPITINETNNTITVTNAAANTVVVQQPAANTLTISASGPQGATGDLVYELAMYAGGLLSAGERVFKHVASRAFSFPAALTTSQLDAGTAATAETVFSLTKNGTSFGTITVAAGGTTGTFAAASVTSFAVGDRLEVRGPNPADTTLEDVSITLRGTKL